MTPEIRQQCMKVYADLCEEWGEKNVMIGGGFVRDTLNNVEPKDMDIYLLSKKHYKVDSWLNSQRVWEPVLSKEYGVPRFVVYKHKELPIDFILSYNKETPDSIIRTYDFNICKCYYYYRKIYKTTDYNIDINNKTLTLCKEYEGSMEMSMKSHLPRLKKKYPEFEFKLEDGWYDTD